MQFKPVNLVFKPGGDATTVDAAQTRKTHPVDDEI